MRKQHQPAGKQSVNWQAAPYSECDMGSRVCRMIPETGKTGKMWYNSLNTMPITLRQQPPALLQRGASSMSNSSTKCKQCGTADRYKNGRCKACSREAVRKWQRNNLEKVREITRKWWQDNPDKGAAARRKWEQANPKKVSEYSRRYRRANPEKLYEANRRWKRANRKKENARRRRWSRDNPEKVNAKSHRYRARKRGNISEPYDFDAICAHYDNRCLRCGKQKPLTVDHIKSVSKGGPNIASNIQPLCKSCNSSKGARCIDYRPDKGPKRWIQSKLFDKF